MQEESSTEVKHGGVASAQEEADTEPEKLISGPQRTAWGRCTSGVGTLTRGSSPYHFANQLWRAHDFYKGLPAGNQPEKVGRLRLHLQETQPLKSRRQGARSGPSSFLAASLPAESHPLPGQAEPPALLDYCRCRAVGVRRPWRSPSCDTAGLSTALPGTAPKEETRGGVAPRDSAAVPGRREPALRGLRRSAIPLPGRPVHLAGEGGRCQ